MKREQRRAPRVTLDTRVVVQTGSQVFVCRSGNLSATGMLLYSSTPLSHTRFVRVLLSLPGRHRSLALTALFVWEAEEQHSHGHPFAIEFHELPLESQLVLRRFIASRSARPSVIVPLRLVSDRPDGRDHSTAARVSTPVRGAYGSRDLREACAVSMYAGSCLAPDRSELHDLYHQAIAQVDLTSLGREPMRFPVTKRRGKY